MKYLFVFLLTAQIYLQCYGQDKVHAVKTTAMEITGRMSLSRYEQNKKQLDSLTSIMTLNVFKFYNLEQKYDSDLKKKVFKESAEFKEKLDLLVKKKTAAKAKEYFLDFEPDYYERNNLLKYDLTNKSFTLTNDIYFEEKNKNSFLQFDKIVLSPVKGITVKYHDYSSGGVKFSKGKINLKIVSELVALKMEENRGTLRVLYVFNILDTTEFTNTLLDAWTFKNHLINCKIKHVFVYNDQTNEIFSDYKPIE
jgi:hypothetical protein